MTLSARFKRLLGVAIADAREAASFATAMDAKPDLAGPNIFTGLLYESAANAITAFAGGGQASATQITTQTTRITVVATAGDSAKLPLAGPGLELVVINSGANSAQIFGLGTDTINGVAAATGVPQMANSICIYSCAVAGLWQCEGIGTGFAGGLPTSSYANAITAFAGGGQASATLLTAVLNRVTVVGTAADSVKLQPSAGGLSQTVTNAHATNSLNVFPSTGDFINALAVNTAFAVPAGKTATFTCTGAAVPYHSVLTA